MCGIVGFIGQEQAAPILLDGLAHLEYRGYDSAGVAVISAQGKLQVEKAVGRLKVLSEQIHGGADLEGCIGLGHTRWATHGAPNIINSHPHVSENGKFAVIHNGIIENYVEIKRISAAAGHPVQASQTDTEVVAQLLEFYMGLNEVTTVSDAVYWSCTGSRARTPSASSARTIRTTSIAARKDAPLLLGFGKGENFIASDVTALVKHTRDVVYMEDGEVAILGRDGIQVYNAHGAAHRKGAPPHRLGDLRRGKGRLRALHAQGDHGAARGAAPRDLPAHQRRQGRLRRSASSTSSRMT